MGNASLVVRVWEEGSHRLVEGAEITLWNEAGDLPGGTTDASGSVEFGGLPEGWVGARVQAAGFANSDPQWKTVGDSGTATLQFAMERGVAVEGIIVAKEDGRPVADASIVAMRGRQVMRSGYAFTERRSDAEGRFGFAAIPRTEGMSEAAVLVVSHESFATVDVVVRPALSDEGPIHLVVKLPAGATLRGTVLDAEGRPVAGARVEAHRGGRMASSLVGLAGGRSWSGSPSGATSITRPRTSESAPDGTFVMTGLHRAEEYTLVVKAKGYAPSEPVISRADDDAPPLEFHLHSPGHLVVRVVDSEGRPVDGAEVSASGALRLFVAEADGPGTWRFAGVEAAGVLLFVKAPGRVDHHRAVKLRAGRTIAARVTMKPAFHLAGVVVDDLGTPISNAKVFASHLRGVAEGVSLEGFPGADGNGRFRIEGLASKKNQLIAQSPRGERVVVEGLVPPADDVRVVLPRTVTVLARFATPDGEQAPGVIHFAYVAGRLRSRRGRRLRNPGIAAPLPIVRRSPAMDRWRRDRVLADGGAAEIRGVAAGGVALWLLAPGFELVEVRVDGRPGDTVDLGTIVLETALELAGRVVDADGGAVAAVHVSVKVPFGLGDSGPWRVQTTTAPDGGFRLGGLRRGRVTLIVGAGGFPPPEFELDVDSGDPVTLTIPRARPARSSADVEHPG